MHGLACFFFNRIQRYIGLVVKSARSLVNIPFRFGHIGR